MAKAIGPEGLFWFGRGVKRLENNRELPARPCWAFSPGEHGKKLAQKRPKAEKLGQNMIFFKYFKSWHYRVHKIREEQKKLTAINGKKFEKLE